MDSNEKNKLKTLLNYLVEHNQEHSQEIKDWAEKAKTLGGEKVAEEMVRAARAMDEASGLLSQSLKNLEEE